MNVCWRRQFESVAGKAGAVKGGCCELNGVEHGSCSGDDVMTTCSRFSGVESWVAGCLLGWAKKSKYVVVLVVMWQLLVWAEKSKKEAVLMTMWQLLV